MAAAALSFYVSIYLRSKESGQKIRGTKEAYLLGIVVIFSFMVTHTYIDVITHPLAELFQAVMVR